MFKKIFWISVLIFLLSGSCYANNTDLYKSVVNKGKIIVGISFDSKPFGFKDSAGNPKGLEVDLAREISKRILGDENKVIFRDISSQDRINKAMSGDVDMVIATMTIDRNRKKFVNFSEPYFIAGQAICVKKDGKIDSIYDLMNKRIIVELGTTGEKNIKRFIPNALIQGYDNNSDAIIAFKSGEAEAITTDDSLLQGLVMENTDYIILPKRLTKEPYGIAFKKSRSSDSFRYKVNKIIKDINLDGTLQAIKDKWIIY